MFMGAEEDAREENTKSMIILMKKATRQSMVRACNSVQPRVQTFYARFTSLLLRDQLETHADLICVLKETNIFTSSLIPSVDDF